MATADITISSFEHYDAEFVSLMKQIEISLSSSDSGNSNTHSSNSSNDYTENLLQQCDELIKQMSLEARSCIDVTLKRDLLAKVRTYKSQHQALQSEYDRISLMSGNGNGGGGGPSISPGKKNGSGADAHYARLQSNEDSLNAQNETLERAKRTMMETEQVALEITEELNNNRETLMNAHGRVREVSTLTGRARRMLSQMNQRAIQQKMLLYAVAIALGFVFLFFLWAMWR